MNDRPMSTDDALALLGGGVGPPDTSSCGVCGVPMHMWWSAEQRRRHLRYHQAQAVAASRGVR